MPRSHTSPVAVALPLVAALVSAVAVWWLLAALASPGVSSVVAGGAVGMVVAGFMVHVGLHSAVALWAEDAVGATIADGRPLHPEFLPEPPVPELGTLQAAIQSRVAELTTQVESVLRDRRRLEQILEHVPAAVGLFDHRLRCEYTNPAAVADRTRRLEILGKRPGEAWLDSFTEDAGENLEEAMKRAFQERRRVTVEQSLIGGDRAERTLVFVFTPVPGEEGEPARILAYGVDITKHRMAERALEESREKLRQSQKMEAIGRLAGSVAHDFNNLLTAISGHADLLMMDFEKEDPRTADLEQIKEGTVRGAALTQQLLAFSRKQVLKAALLDLNQIVRGVEPMLHRLIGEDVELVSALASNLERVRADRGQLEQVIMNLVVNARDAMPQGGRLTLETRQATYGETVTRAPMGSTPPRCAVLVVRDSGSGIDPETLRSIFEPFFTTKGKKGTGLGLATVYGIVTQTGGFVHVESEVGEGTAFHIYLPCSAYQETGEMQAVEEVGDARGSETILLVEDEEIVRNLAGRILQRHGYNVLTAENAEEASHLSQAYPEPIHLLLTDVVMPGRSGRELADEIEDVRPDTRILFMSGYTDEAIVRYGVIGAGSAFLEKPFSATFLAQSVRRILDDQPLPTGQGASPNPN